MILVGVSWVVFWLMADVFKVELLMAALVTGIMFILLGLLFGERLPDWPRRP